MLPAVATSLTDCAVETAAAVTVKLALDAVAGIVTEDGAFKFELLLESAIVTPPFGAEPVSVSLQESEPVPAIEPLLQEIALSAGAVLEPAPLRLTVAGVASLAMISCPFTALVVDGLNWTVRTICWPGESVAGKLALDRENPVPVMESDLMVTGDVPDEVRVTDLLTAVPTETLPKASVEALSVSAGADDFELLS